MHNVILEGSKDPIGSICLANNLAVVFGHSEEFGNSHLTLGHTFGVLPAAARSYPSKLGCDSRLRR